MPKQFAEPYKNWCQPQRLRGSCSKGICFHHLLSLWYTANFSNAFGRCVCPLLRALLNKIPLLSVYALSVLPMSFINMEREREGKNSVEIFGDICYFFCTTEMCIAVGKYQTDAFACRHTHTLKSKTWRSCWCVSKLHLPQGNTVFLGEMTVNPFQGWPTLSVCVLVVFIC